MAPSEEAASVHELLFESEIAGALDALPYELTHATRRFAPVVLRVLVVPPLKPRFSVRDATGAPDCVGCVDGAVVTLAVATLTQPFLYKRTS